MHASGSARVIWSIVVAYWGVDAETGGETVEDSDKEGPFYSVRNTGLPTITRAVLRICIHIHIPHTYICLNGIMYIG